MKMNKKILSIVLTGVMIIGSVGMVYADGENKNDRYKDDKELQEIFEVYENADKNSDMLLAPNPMAEENAEIKVAKDGTIQLKLEENITTGCTWHVEIENEGMLKVNVDEYKDLDKSEDNKDKEIICGAPGVHVWNFKALKEGTTKITFKLYQDWESKKVYDTKEYTVTIGKEGEKQVYVNSYADNKELQEIFKIYDNTDKNSDMLLAPNPMAEENTETKVEKDIATDENKKGGSNLLQKLVRFCLNIFSM